MRYLRRLYKHFLGGLGVFGISLCFLIFSCSQKLPTAPQGNSTALNSPGSVPFAPPGNPHGGLTDADVGDDDGEIPADTVITFDPGKMDSTEMEVGAAVFRTVSYDGDTIAFPIGNGSKDTAYLILPRGALKKGTNVTLNLKGDVMRTTDSTMLVAMYNFLPHGLVYEKDCYLVQPARFKDGTKLALLWYDPLSGKWTEENVGVVANGRVVFVIKHFSNYGAPLEALSSGGQ